jgi:hypothetical protein
MPEEESIKTVAAQLDVLLGGNDFAANKKILAERINELILHDFQKLISILYRLDVSEEKLKRLLKETVPGDAGLIITDLIIERQIQKIESRQRFSQQNDDIDEKEKW